MSEAACYILRKVAMASILQWARSFELRERTKNGPQKEHPSGQRRGACGAHNGWIFFCKQKLEQHDRPAEVRHLQERGHHCIAHNITAMIGDESSGDFATMTVVEAHRAHDIRKYL